MWIFKFKISVTNLFPTAHCLDRNTPPSLINLYGNSTSRLSDGILFFVTRYVNHPDYRRISLSTGQVIWDYDVSVIEVDRENPLDGLFVRPTVLPPTCNSACCGACEGTVITLAGWGKFMIYMQLIADHWNVEFFKGRTHLGTLPVYLQKLNQTIVNHAACGPFWENQITDRMFCVTADFYDSCDGDSGSGILLTDRVNQIGYVSFGSWVLYDLTNYV